MKLLIVLWRGSYFLSIYHTSIPNLSIILSIIVSVGVVAEWLVLSSALGELSFVVIFDGLLRFM